MEMKPIQTLCQSSDDELRCALNSKYGTDWMISRLTMDSGAEGDIYIAKSLNPETEGSYLVKHIKKTTLDKINNEVCYQIEASELNLSPKIIDAWLCDDTSPESNKFRTGVIVMEKAGNINVLSYINNVLRKINGTSMDDFNKFMTLVDIFKEIVIKTYKLNTRGIYHNTRGNMQNR